MKRKIISLLLVAALVVSISAPALAADPKAQSCADALNSLGLFRGSDKGYELDRKPTRLEGLIMLLRMLGEENAALAYAGSTAFTDLEYWDAGQPYKYTGYAYDKGYTKGTDEVKMTFEPNDLIDVKSYITFLLRALDYNDSNGDFAWDTAVESAVQLGMLSDKDATSMQSSFTRGDMVMLSYAALKMNVKNGEKTLAQRLMEQGVFSETSARAQGILPEVSQSIDAVVYEQKSFALASGNLTADVLTVDTKDSRVSLHTDMVNSTIGATAPFENIAKNSGAYAVVNGNFFEAYQDFKNPIGHVMSDGEFLYGMSGLPALCIREDGSAEIARPSVFFAIRCDYTFWACFEKNTAAQDYYNTVLYTPAWGSELEITFEGLVTVVENGVISSVTQMPAGSTVKIPSNGFVMHFGGDFTSTGWYKAPTVGTKVWEDPYIQVEDPVGFNLVGMKQIVSGAPTLVRNGIIETNLETGFQEERFTTMSSPRTAVGVKNDGKVVIVSVQSATIQQMRELMLAIGCKDAFNLDGGASCAMYVDGKIIRSPGRELTVTLQIFVK